MQTVPFSPDQASSFAGEVDALYGFLWALTIVIGSVISLLILYFAVKYRRRNEDEIPRPVRASHRLEAVWVGVPFVVAMGIFVWSAGIYYRMYRPPEEAIDVYVVAKQWMWKFQHLDGHREINVLHVPVGRKVKLTMTTEDVIHSFFVPAFRVKMDVVPGKYSTIWFEPTKAGRYHLFCAEYCGTSHSGMIGWVDVLEAPEYQAWLSGGAAGGSLAATGEKLFQQLACSTCHKSDGTGRGPVLEGVFGKTVQLANGQRVTADEAYVRESITNPKAKVVAGYDAIMPTFQGQVSEEQLLQLIAYIRSLAGVQAPAPQGGASPAVQQARPAPAPAQMKQSQQ
ncbi:MAG TPA: cytochrome c oxidase subunit II [Blastocatellia bacterium]|nr:cytochrome c oxidase subunit II [Blastocatellia bacterium]